MDIALAIIVDPARRMTLIAQRPEGVHLALRWEFPGGKINLGETAQACAIREALEETGLAVAVLAVWEPITFAYPERTLTLHPMLCEAGELQPVNARWRWVEMKRLGEYDFPEANADLIERLATI